MGGPSCHGKLLNRMNDLRKPHIVLYSDDPEFGGVAQYNHSILMALAEAGYAVTCIQPPSRSPMTKAQSAAGIRHEWIGYDAKNDFTRSIVDRADAKRLFGCAKPDFVIFSDCCPLSNIAARQEAIERGIPFLVVVGFVAKYLAERFKVCLPVLAKQYASARQVVAVSRENLDLLTNSFGLPDGKGLVIHYGRPGRFFAPPNESLRNRYRAEMQLPENAVVCFSAARLTPSKGFQHILAAALQLRETPAHFVWAGDGELIQVLKDQIKLANLEERFRILGQRWDVCELLEAADIFLLPSHNEGMPLSIMEAMARGVPVIASAVSGIPEELADTGCLIPNPEKDRFGAVLEMTRQIKAWTEDREQRCAAGRACRARAEAMFREELMISRSLALLDLQLSRG